MTIAASASTGSASTASASAPSESAESTETSSVDGRETVFLLHGLGRTPVSMMHLARRLDRAGYRPIVFGYWSTAGDIHQIARRLGERVRAAGRTAPRIHFVAHSLGNIIIRSMLHHDAPEKVGRIVMLAPPNQGSRKADRYTPWIGWLTPHIQHLRTAEDSTARTLRLPDGVEVGIVAGARDGKVSVAESRLDGARDHAVVPCTHSFIMHRTDVHRLVVEFLRDGRFAAST